MKKLTLLFRKIPTIDPDLLAWWKLDGNGIDEVNDNTATVHSDTYVSGKDGQAADLTSSYITVSPANKINNLWDSGGTITTWIYLFSRDRYATVSAKDQADGYGGYYWSINVNGNFYNFEFEIHFDSGRGLWDIGEALPTDEWVHVAVGFNANSDSNIPSMYVNGVKKSLNTIASPSGTRPDDSNQDLYFGAEVNGNNLNAYMDDIRIYNKVLSETEVSDLYNSY